MGGGKEEEVENEMERRGVKTGGILWNNKNKIIPKLVLQLKAIV